VTPDGALVVVPAARQHAYAIRALEDLGPSTLALLEYDLTAPTRCALVAIEADQVVGFAVASVGAGESHLLDVAVAPDVRRRGIGAALVTRLRETVARERGADAMTLEVRPSNTAARALYRRLGFVEAGERPGYYPDGGPDGGREAAVIMWDRDLARLLPDAATSDRKE
jgi:[ribosomal protein S18]-alanine N-acetyltransferase